MKKPNILLIMCDQLRADALTVYGGEFVQTPHMDRIAQTGVTFERAYSRTPVCMPARHGLMSGIAPFKLGLIDNGPISKPIAHPLPVLLKQAGYFTAAVGKMHFSPVRAHHGFDRMYLSEEIPGHYADDDYLLFLKERGRLDVAEPHGKRSESYYVPQTSELPEGLHTTAWTAQKTCELVQQNCNRPFFIFTSFIKPHPPFDPCKPYDVMYDPNEVPLPIMTEDERNPVDLSIDVQNDYKVGGIQSVSSDDIRRIRASYYGCVTQVDKQIGVLLDQLEKLGLRENTLVLLTSDHGEMLGDHYSFGKRTYYEASAKIPFIASWPAVLPKGEKRAQFAVLEDVYATVASAAGADIPSECDGVDLLPAALDPTAGSRPEVIGEFGKGRMLKFMLRWDNYKYVYHTNGGRETLFDLGADPAELTDIAGDHEGLCRSCRKKLVQYYRNHMFFDAVEGEALKRFELMGHQPRGFLDQFPRWPETLPSEMR